ncbi:hypothetical protein ACNKHL_11935 [Shigella flexneri]
MAGRDLVMWNNYGADEYLYPVFKGKAFFNALFLQIFYMGSGFVTD